MGTTRTLADDEAFVEGRSQATAAKLVTAAAEAGLKGSVRTTYDGYVAPTAVVEAAGVTPTSVGKSSTPERGEGAPVDPLEASPAQTADGDVPEDAIKAVEGDETGEAGDTEETTDLFDPTKATVAEVEAYLTTEDISDEERARVIAAEQESAKPRKGVLDLAANTEEGK